MSEAKGKCILAVDLGTGGPKVALVTTRGEVLAHEFEETPLILLPGGGAEQKPADWWQAITTASSRLMARGLVPVSDVAGVCCTSQWSGTVAVGPDGEPLFNAIIWMDSRGARYIREMVDGPMTIEGYSIAKLRRWIKLTGGVPTRSGKDPIAHILWLKNEHPEIYDRTYKFLEPKDYLNLRLTGEYGSSFDSITLHWVTDNRDITDVTYSPKLLRWSGIDPDKLPELTPVAAVVGKLRPAAAEELGIPAGVPVVSGTPDVPGAALGSGAVRDFESHLYVGTSSWLTCHVPFKKTSLLHSMAALPSAIPGRYFVANEQETAGACVKFFRDNILFSDDALAAKGERPDYYQGLNAIAAAAPPGSDKVLFLPWLYGERTPVDDHSVRGGFYNVSLKTTRAHLARSIFEGVAYNSKWLLGYLEKFCGREMNPIHYIGGGANSAVWCQIFADVFDRTIRQVRDPIEANVRGAGLQGAMGLELTGLDEVAEGIAVEQEYAPNPDNRGIYDELFGEFLTVYKKNKRIHARLNAS